MAGKKTTEPGELDNREPEKAPEIRYRMGRPAWVARVLLAITALLVLVHVGANLSALRWDNTVTRVLVLEFSVNAENNVPTFFSTALLLLAALLLAVVSQKNQLGPFAKRWTLLSMVFLWLALDETAGMHEYLNDPFRKVLGVTGPLYYAWVVPGALLTVVFCMYYLRFLWHLPARTSRLFITAGLLFVGGAIGIEMLGAWYFSHTGVKDFSYDLLTAIEESLEMTGIIVFIYALLDYLQCRSEYLDSDRDEELPLPLMTTSSAAATSEKEESLPQDAVSLKPCEDNALRV